MNPVPSYADLALSVWKRYVKSNQMTSYTTILAYHGAARLAKITKTPALLDEVKTLLIPFLTGDIKDVAGAYGKTVYKSGGNAAAYLVERGDLPEALPWMIEHADLLRSAQSRDALGRFDHPRGNRTDGSRGYLWIDTVFGICPFLLWTGLAAKRPEYIDEACFQMIEHHKVLFDPKLKVYHQAFNAVIPGTLTPGHWGRGHGWGVLALAELVYDLPKDHPQYQTLLAMFREAMEGTLALQDPDGMWHQALEDHGSYVESSGTGLILYAMGRGIKNGSLDEKLYRDAYLKGLRALTRYVAADGSVFNCCIGCLAPGVNGTVADYALHPWKLNDSHAFGPVIIAMGVAESLERNGRIPKLAELLED